ncbi:MAG: transcriptional repressor [Chromatiales bacterium]|nr:transcriptional repressor [Gammaproteobacteria bacterium]MCP5351912.1 transcriptional repressor [Chromatiales bacterium]
MYAPTIDWPTDTDAILARLRACGISPTAQRVEIARALLSRPQHLSADQVLAVVNRERSSVSKATIYNTLALFAEKGLVREVIVDPSRVFYDSNTEPHHHLYQVEDGALSDIALNSIALDGLPALPEGMEIDRVDVIVRVRKPRD